MSKPKPAKPTETDIRTDEREACCRDICWHCERGESITRADKGLWRHTATDWQSYECLAEAIRERAFQQATEQMPSVNW
jgi:hypothetical protein